MVRGKSSSLPSLSKTSRDTLCLHLPLNTIFTKCNSRAQFLRSLSWSPPVSSFDTLFLFFRRWMSFHSLHCFLCSHAYSSRWRSSQRGGTTLQNIMLISISVSFKITCMAVCLSLPPLFRSNRHLGYHPPGTLRVTRKIVAHCSIWTSSSHFRHTTVPWWAWHHTYLLSFVASSPPHLVYSCTSSTPWSWCISRCHSHSFSTAVVYTQRGRLLFGTTYTAFLYTAFLPYRYGWEYFNSL